MRIVMLVLVLLAGVVAAVEGALPCSVAAISPECYVALRPGPTRDVLELLDVPGEAVTTSAGQLVLTTVAVDSSLDVEDLFSMRDDPTVERADRDLYFPPSVDEEVTRQAFAAMMTESELSASVAALSELGFELPPDGARVEAVIEDGPSGDVVETGDIITAVDDGAVTTADDFADAVRTAGRGTEVTLTVRTVDGEEQRSLVLGANPEDETAGFAGLFVSTNVDVPVDVEFTVEGIGGPSAGLMFALTIVDLLSEDDLTGGRIIAGTGEIAFDGRVGAIGGIKQKLPGAVQRPRDEEADARAASVFLLPRGNVDEARDAVPGADLLLVPVDTLGDAVEALRTLRDGGTPQDSFTLPAEGLVAADAG